MHLAGGRHRRGAGARFRRRDGDRARPLVTGHVSAGVGERVRAALARVRALGTVSPKSERIVSVVPGNFWMIPASSRVFAMTCFLASSFVMIADGERVASALARL